MGRQLWRGKSPRVAQAGDRNAGRAGFLQGTLARIQKCVQFIWPAQELRLLMLAEVGCLHALTFNLSVATLRKNLPAEACRAILPPGVTQQPFLVPDQDGETVPISFLGLSNSSGILRRLLQVAAFRTGVAGQAHPRTRARLLPLHRLSTSDQAISGRRRGWQLRRPPPPRIIKLDFLAS